MSFTVTLTPTGGAIPSELVNVIKGDPGSGGGGAVTSVAGRTGAVTLAAADITDSTATGRAVLQAASQAAARTAIDAAASGHTHTGTYQPLAAVLTATTASFTTAQETKLGHITVTQAVDLDAIETRVNDLDAAVVLKGTWDASGGTFPGAGAAQAGWSYIVSVAGTVDGVAWAVGDRAIAIADNASTSTYAAHWFKADYTDRVSSVNGRTGAVTTGAADITDSTAAGRAILTAADTAAQRSALGLGTAATLDHGTSAGNLVRLDATTGKLPPVDGSLLINLPSGGATPAGSGTELQYRSGASSFGAVTGSSVDGASLTLGGETVTASKPVLNLSQTWNNASVAFVGRRLDITATAALAGSLLDEIRVGGVAKWSVTPGLSQYAQAIASVSGYSNSTNYARMFAASTEAGFRCQVDNGGFMQLASLNGYGSLLTASSAQGVYFRYGVQLTSGGRFSWSSTSDATAAEDTAVMRDSAGVAAVTNATAGAYRDLKLRNLIGTGNLAMGMAAKTADYTLTVNDGAISFDASAAARTATLPALSTCQAGQLHFVWKTDSSGNAVSADANASETINGSTSAFSTTTQWGLLVLQVNADKSGWLARAL